MDEWNPLVKPVPGQAYQVTKDEIDEYLKSLQIETEIQEPSDAAYNSVTKPKHYMLFEKEGIEVRDVCSKLVNKVREGSHVPFWKDNNLFESDYVQMMQYLMRFMDKNGKEDLEKARWYLDKLIEAY